MTLALRVLAPRGSDPQRLTVLRLGLVLLLDCAHRNVTGLVDVFETAGLVVRAPHPTDRRARPVTLTPTGAQQATAWEADPNRAFAMVFAGLAEGELGTSDKVLEQVLTRLRPGEPRPGGTT